jgi:hypothetical protein
LLVAVIEELLVTIDPASGAPVSGAAAPDPTAAGDPSAALTDVRNQLLRLGQQIAEMRTEGPIAGVEAVNGVVAELREAVRFLAERMDGVARMVAQRGEELADTRGALGAIDAHVRSQAETIAVLSTGMQALPSYGERVSALQDNLNVLQQRLGGIEGAFGPLGQRLGGIESAVARPDSGTSERLAAIEGMLGPLSQRLGQALTEQAASLQALHGRVESVASGTQAALAAPVQVDEAAVAALEPRLHAIVSELAALRADISGLGSAAPSGGSSAADFAALREQIAALAGSGGVAVGAGSADGGPSTIALAQDIDVALRRIESRINDHIDDAVLALAQTLLGKPRSGAEDDELADVEPVATGWPEHGGAAADDSDLGYVEPVYGASDYSADDDFEAAPDAAGTAFSAVQFADDDPEPAAWSAPAPAYADPDDQAARDAAYLAQTGAADLYDQDAAAWGGTQRTTEHPSVVPERRRRWFSK